MSKDIEIRRPNFEDRAIVLRDNSFAIYVSADTIEDKIASLLSLIPMALDVVSEARETIARLREENEKLTREK